jgi:hypothetical protein
MVETTEEEEEVEMLVTQDYLVYSHKWFNNKLYSINFSKINNNYLKILELVFLDLDHH